MRLRAAGLSGKVCGLEAFGCWVRRGVELRMKSKKPSSSSDAMMGGAYLIRMVLGSFCYINRRSLLRTA